MLCSTWLPLDFSAGIGTPPNRHEMASIRVKSVKPGSIFRPRDPPLESQQGWLNARTDRHHGRTTRRIGKTEIR